MGALLKLIAKGILFLPKMLAKLIFLLLPSDVKNRIVNRKKFSRKNVSAEVHVVRLRRRSTVWAIISGLAPWILFLVLFLSSKTTDEAPSGEPAAVMSNTETMVMLGIVAAPFLLFGNSCRKAIANILRYRAYNRYAAALWWESECSLEAFAQRLNTQKKVTHLGAPSYVSAGPEDISTKRNLPPTPLSGKKLRRAAKKAQKTLLFFLKKRLFTGAYVNLQTHHIGNLRLEEQRAKQAALLADKPVFIRVTCVDCGTSVLMAQGSLEVCGNCGAPVLERLCNTACDVHGDCLSERCVLCNSGCCADGAL
ncbi:MAG: hypothetical protein LBT21_04725 [Oscillospiraceae bacterium]|jgi:ribosomal protein S27AE|nr:hypothetical protein [Oscillospiraceae bacterium]